MHDQLAGCVCYHMYGEIANSVHILNPFLFLMHCTSFLETVHECMRVRWFCECIRCVSGELTNWKTIAWFSFMCFAKHDMNFTLRSFSTSVDGNTLLAISRNPTEKERKNSHGRVNNGPFYYRTAYIFRTFNWNTHPANWIGFSWIENDGTRNFKIYLFRSSSSVQL